MHQEISMCLAMGVSENSKDSVSQRNVLYSEHNNIRNYQQKFKFKTFCIRKQDYILLMS